VDEKHQRGWQKREKHQARGGGGNGKPQKDERQGWRWGAAKRAKGAKERRVTDTVKQKQVRARTEAHKEKNGSKGTGRGDETKNHRPGALRDKGGMRSSRAAPTNGYE